MVAAAVFCKIVVNSADLAGALPFACLVHRDARL
jgi:hypothetical protein